MRRILALGDSHFDETRRLDETIRVHQWIADQANALGVDEVIHCGDVYERDSTPTERHAVADWIESVSCHLTFVRGNHDAPLDVAFLARLEGVAAHEGPGILYDGTIVLPWPTRAGLLAAAAVAGHDVPTDSDLRVLLQTILRGLHGPRPRVLAAHVLVDGSVTSTGQPLRSAPMNVALDDLALARPDVVLLAHIHMPQGWALRIEEGLVLGYRPLVDGERLVAPWVPVAYTGSPVRTTYGETEEKSVLLVDLDDEGGVTVKRLRTPTRPMILSVGSYADGVFALDPRPSPGDGADVRVRYAVSFDQRDAARAASAEIEALWTQDGSVARVTWEPETTSEVRVRAPEVAAAVTVGEKLAALRAYRGESLLPERTKRLAERLHHYEGAVAARSSGRDRAASVRFRRLRIVGLGALVDVDLDLASLPSIVAVCGPNGAGKSTLLEAAPIALWRRTATRSSLRDLATSRETVVEAHVTIDGEDLIVRQDADAASGRGEWSVTRRDDFGEGAPVLADSKLTTGEAWASARLPDLDLWMASCFAAQGSEGYLGLDPRDRKRLLLSALGIDVLEALAAEARADATELGEAVRVLRARATDAEARSGSLADAEASARTARDLLAGAQMTAAQAETDLSAGMTRWQAWQDRDAARREAVARARGLEDVLRAARVTLDAAKERAEALRRERASVAIPSSWPDQEPLRVAVYAARGRSGAAAVRVAVAVAAQAEAVRAVQAAGREEESLSRRLRECEAAGVRLREDPAPDLAAAEAAHRAAEATYHEAERVSREAVGLSLGASERRIEGLRAGLRSIRDMTGGEQYLASQTLAADDELAKATSSAALAAARGASVEALRRWQAAGQAADAARRAHQAQESLRAAAAEVGEAYTRAEGARGRRMAAEEALARAGGEVDEAAAEQTAARAAEAVAEAALADAERFTRLRERCDRLRADETEALHAVSRALLSADEAERSWLEAADRVGSEEPTEARPDDGAARSARAAVTAAERALATAEAVLARALSDEAESLRLGEALTAGELDFEDATRLAEELGRSGLQSHEIDAAGPRLSELSNGLLHSCYGGRWTVRFTTVRPKKGSDELTDCYEIEVADSATGAVRPAKTYSGGERTILSEAIGLAITAFLCARRGVSAPTLFRDESGAALDAEKLEPYLAMLRKGAEALGGAQVLVVSHSETLRAACDGRIVVGGGTVRAE